MDRAEESEVLGRREYRQHTSSTPIKELQLITDFGFVSKQKRKIDQNDKNKMGEADEKN